MDRPDHDRDDNNVINYDDVAQFARVLLRLCLCANSHDSIYD